jgi:hypothetical protein
MNERFLDVPRNSAISGFIGFAQAGSCKGDSLLFHRTGSACRRLAGLRLRDRTELCETTVGIRYVDALNPP